jgi:hypothetical protein
MGRFNLTDDHIDPQLERQFLATLSREPSLYWELAPTEELFHEYGQAFQDLSGAIEAEEEPPETPEDWTAAADPESALKKLRDLWQRYELARLEEALARRLNDPDDPAPAILEDLEEEAAQIRNEIQSGDGGTLRENEDVVSDVLEEAKEAREHFQAWDWAPG